MSSPKTTLGRAPWRAEWFLAISLASCLAFAVAGKALESALASPLVLAFVLCWLFAAILGSAMSVVRHAEHIAARLGEPYGTLILTLSVTFIEVVSISAVMLHGENNPTLVRDTLMAVIMIILNGMVGLSLLVGAWKHREQQYNLQGANAYLGVIIPLAVLSLVLPNYTVTTAGPTLSQAQERVLALMTVGLYV
ncbi:MAG: calcium:proton antiporter, partial [Acidobacteriota bacterium]|nr:calcium:proton antiporter [Acidobacteriota bacterium]